MNPGHSLTVTRKRAAVRRRRVFELVVANVRFQFGLVANTTRETLDPSVQPVVCSTSLQFSRPSYGRVRHGRLGPTRIGPDCRAAKEKRGIVMTVVVEGLTKIQQIISFLVSLPRLVIIVLCSGADLM